VRWRARPPRHAGRRSLCFARTDAALAALQLHVLVQQCGQRVPGPLCGCRGSRRFRELLFFAGLRQAFARAELRPAQPAIVPVLLMPHGQLPAALTRGGQAEPARRRLHLLRRRRRVVNADGLAKGAAVQRVAPVQLHRLRGEHAGLQRAAVRQLLDRHVGSGGCVFKERRDAARSVQAHVNAVDGPRFSASTGASSPYGASEDTLSWCQFGASLERNGTESRETTKDLNH